MHHRLKYERYPFSAQIPKISPRFERTFLTCAVTSALSSALSAFAKLSNTYGASMTLTSRTIELIPPTEPANACMLPI
jgi:hypothetical protein